MTFDGVNVVRNDRGSVPHNSFGISFDDGKLASSKEALSLWRGTRRAGSKAILGEGIAEWRVSCIVDRLRNPIGHSLFEHGWSPSLYKKDRWHSASAVAVEINVIGPQSTRELITPEKFCSVIQTHQSCLPGSFAYFSTYSIFLVFVLSTPITTDHQDSVDSKGSGFYAAVCRGAAELVRKALEELKVPLTSGKPDLSDDEYTRYMDALMGMHDLCNSRELDGRHACEGLLVIPRCQLYQTIPLPVNGNFMVLGEQLYDSAKLAKKSPKHFIHPACHDPDRLCWYFFHWLNVAISEKKAYLTCPKGRLPEVSGISPALVGWWPSQQSRAVHEPQGKLVGWIDVAKGRIHLLPEASVSVVSQACGELAMTLPFTEKTIGTHLVKKGWLESHRESDHNAVKGTVVINGIKRRLRAYRLRLTTWILQLPKLSCSTDEFQRLMGDEGLPMEQSETGAFGAVGKRGLR